jgi:hypothetical protein
VRSRKRGETASIFLPSVPLLMAHARGTSTPSETMRTATIQR